MSSITVRLEKRRIVMVSNIMTINVMSLIYNFVKCFIKNFIKYVYINSDNRQTRNTDAKDYWTNGESWSIVSIGNQRSPDQVI
jgi:hypothetical protein